MKTIRTRTKLIGAGATIVALSAAGIGVAAADPSSSSSPSAQPSSSASHANGAKTDKGDRGKHHKRQLLSRALHGEATLGGAKKTRVVDFQRGTVTKVDGSVITIKSADGFSASYTADSKTKVRKDKKQSSIGDVKVNDRVRVIGTKSGTTITLKHVGDAGPKK